jgi:hypothetical protein
MTIHILTDDKGRRYCRDGQFREFANFGTGRTCVKEYKRKAYADKVIYRHNDECERLGRDSKIESWTIYHLHDGDKMDAVGNITREKS